MADTILTRSRALDTLAELRPSGRRSGPHAGPATLPCGSWPPRRPADRPGSDGPGTTRHGSRTTSAPCAACLRGSGSVPTGTWELALPRRVLHVFLGDGMISPRLRRASSTTMAVISLVIEAIGSTVSEFFSSSTLPGLPGDHEGRRMEQRVAFLVDLGGSGGEGGTLDDRRGSNAAAGHTIALGDRLGHQPGPAQPRPPCRSWRVFQPWRRTCRRSDLLGGCAALQQQHRPTPPNPRKAHSAGQPENDGFSSFSNQI